VRQRLLQVEAEIKAIREKARTEGKRDALRELMALKERYAKKAPPPPPPPGLTPGQAVGGALLGKAGPAPGDPGRGSPGPGRPP